MRPVRPILLARLQRGRIRYSCLKEAGVGLRTRMAHNTCGWWGQRVRELEIVVSCGRSSEKGWRTELQLGRGQSLDDHHRSATVGAEPKRIGWLRKGDFWFPPMR